MDRARPCASRGPCLYHRPGTADDIREAAAADEDDGWSNGLGCYPELPPADEQAAGATPDQFHHEFGTAYNLRGKGLVVLSSCSHRGIVSIVKQAQAASGVQKLHAVLGGFHLAPYKEDYVRQTIAELKDIDPGYLIPMHCADEPFYDIAGSDMPGNVQRSQTGTRFVFSP